MWKILLFGRRFFLMSLMSVKWFGALINFHMPDLAAARDLNEWIAIKTLPRNISLFASAVIWINKQVSRGVVYVCQIEQCARLLANNGASCSFNRGQWHSTWCRIASVFSCFRARSTRVGIFLHLGKKWDFVVCGCSSRWSRKHLQ